VGPVAFAVTIRTVPSVVICWMAKPGKENGSVGKKEHLRNDLLGTKTVSSIFFYEEGLQTQHAKCGRSNFREGILQ